MGWWGAAFFGETDVALALGVTMVMMRPTDSDTEPRGVTLMGALPSQLQSFWPGARGRPKSLRGVVSWAEKCDVELGQQWLRSGVKMVDLLIASEFWLTLEAVNLPVVRDGGRAAHAMRALPGARVMVLDEQLQPKEAKDGEVTGLIGISGPQVSPGYAERHEGRTTIGSGPMSKDTFKIVDKQVTVVPKDLVRRHPDGTFLSIGRAGGTVKVKGGVLMATNVVELQLQQRSIKAACITEPLHLEGGAAVVLELDWQNAWSLR